MIAAVVVLAVLAFIVWMVYRAIRGQRIKAHMVSYGVACVAGIFTYVYFLSLDMPQLIKIVVSIFLGIVLIIVAALLQRRMASRS
jgi:hypothetical protein